MASLIAGARFLFSHQPYYIENLKLSTTSFSGADIDFLINQASPFFMVRTTLGSFKRNFTKTDTNGPASGKAVTP
jgi:hypothetical protein